jgi:MoaA/NifB/PqqE/SkfB family radical SAM enzyme
MSHEDKNIIAKTESSTLCVLPWIHLATSPNGKTKLCCIAVEEYGDLSKNSVDEIWNSEYINSVRTKMLNNETVSACYKCSYQESLGITSKRQRENSNWGTDIIASSTIKYLDLRFGNTCNLKCVMCSPNDSSLWIKDHDLMYSTIQNSEVKQSMNWDKTSLNNTWFKDTDFRESIYNQIPNLRQVFFAGGEPLLIKENLLLVKKIIELGYQDRITLRYSTNGLLITEELISLWSKFSSVIINISIDACGKRDEYIRYPTSFKEVESGLRLLDNTPKNIQVTFATAVQILNIKHMPEFVKWADSHNIKTHMLYAPSYLSVQCLPAKDKTEVHALFNELGSEQWQNILNFMDAEDTSHLLPAFKEYITKLDIIRDTDASTVFPELAHLL